MDKSELAHDMMNSKGFEQKWNVYMANSPELLILPPPILRVLRLAFYAGGVAATQTMLELHHDMITQVLDQLASSSSK